MKITVFSNTCTRTALLEFEKYIMNYFLAKKRGDQFGIEFDNLATLYPYLYACTNKIRLDLPSLQHGRM